MKEFMEGQVYLELVSMFETVNAGINPLTNIPEPIMCIYCHEENFTCRYYDTLEELKENIHSIFSSRVYSIEYIGSVAGKDNVIRQNFPNNTYRLISYVSPETYEVYNDKKSICKGDYVWDKYYGDIRNFYNAFNERGINFNTPKTKRYAVVSR